MSNLKLVVFDCDGTLVDSQHSIVQSMEFAFAKYGLAPPTREAIRRIVGLPLYDAIAHLAPGQDDVMVRNLQAGYSEEWHRMRATGDLDEPLYPGTLDAISRLSKEGWLLGVATGKSYKGLVATLTHFGIIDQFVTLQTSDKVSRGKPFPDMLLAALNEAGVNAQEAVMVGDTTYDIEMSVNAGVRAIGVNWGYHDAHELLARGADCVIDRYEDLHAAINPKPET